MLLARRLRVLALPVLALALAATAQTPTPATATPVPALSFFKAPTIQSAKLSPSGRWLAITAAIGGKRIGLLSVDLNTPGKVTTLAHFFNLDVDRFHWVGDERLVFTLTQNDRGSADQDYAPGLLSVHRDGSDLQPLVEAQLGGLRELSLAKRKALPFNHILLSVPSTGDAEEVIVGAYKYDGKELAEVQPMRLNVATGRATALSGLRVKNAKHWLFDWRGQARVAFARQGGRTSIFWREGADAEWQLLFEADSLNMPFEPFKVDHQGKLLVAEHSGPGGTRVLKRFDMTTRQPEPQPWISAPGFDVNPRALEIDGDSGQVLGVHLDTDAYGAVWFDARLKALQADADQRWPGRVNQLTCARCRQADMTVLARSWSDRDPGQYWFYRAQDKVWKKLGDIRPDVEPRRMATLDFHRIKARDGKDLPLWLTLPAGHKKGDRPPAVVLVHGGPWVRGGHWEWDAWPQFLASRGFAVIEPEIRGSTGYGQAHFRAGWKQWGTTMQDDVADALAWAREQGHVSAERACIAGASYGGYAALMGPIRQPGLYRCAVAWMAPTDLLLRYQWSTANDLDEEGRLYALPALVGDPVADADLLKAASPLRRVSELKLPLLLAVASEDQRVPMEHGNRLRDALTALGRPPQFVVYAGEGHFIWTTEHMIDWAEQMERFLNQHLK